MQTVKITPEQMEFLQANASHLKIDESNEDWFYMPFWFKKVGDDIVEMYNFENLPPHVIDKIKEHRK